MLIAVQVSVLGSYLPPVFNRLLLLYPPQTIISLPVQTAVWANRAVGALVVLVGVQVSVLGLYFPPVLRPLMRSVVPPQTIISLPVHTAVGSIRPSGAFVMLVAVHVSSVHGGAPLGILPKLWGRKNPRNIPA